MVTGGAGGSRLYIKICYRSIGVVDPQETNVFTNNRVNSNNCYDNAYAISYFYFIMAHLPTSVQILMLNSFNCRQEEAEVED